MGKTICVLVLYNPNMQLLQKVISSIIDQVDLLYISDNSTDLIDITGVLSNHNKIKYEKMPGNIGIAAAQNFGIDYAINNGFEYLYYLDQDSISPKDIIKKLKSVYTDSIVKDNKIGAVGPRPFNRNENKEYRGSVKKGKVISHNITEVTELISSASLIKVNTFKDVGNMEASLFIDGVDHEWCWRANKLGEYKFYINEDAILSHQFGEGDRKFIYKKVAITTPFRIYFQYRNYFRLLRRDYVPLYWKLSNAIKYFIKLFYYPICISPRRIYLQRILSGIKDGILNK